MTLSLSYAQQRLWFLHQLLGANAIFNIPVLVRIQGPLDAGALEVALGDVVARHESLRTLFAQSESMDESGGEQRIIDDITGLLVFDNVGVDEAMLLAEARKRATHAFELSREIPIRATLFTLGQEQHALLLVLHHIAGDGASLAPLFRDLGQAYAARCHGHAPDWLALPVQYADYALWQREYLAESGTADTTVARQAAFWRDTLADLPDQLNLPGDRPRPAAPSYRGALTRFVLDAQTEQRLGELARGAQASLYMVLHTALAALLTRYGAGEDLPIGTSVSSRNDEALNDLVGFFVNLLVLRTDTSGNPSFRELLRRVRDTDLAAFSYQELPFEHVVDIVKPARSAARHPLFQVALILDNHPATFALAGTVAHWQHLSTDTAKYDLAFSFIRDETSGRLACELEYACDLFDAATAVRLATHFERLLRAGAMQPDLPIADIALLDDEERQQVLHAWNDTVQPLTESTLPALFVKQAMATPDAWAAIAGQQRLSYRELETRANRLAHHLLALGVGPDTLVGLCLERSLDLLVGTLGVLKAGAAYLPLDPEYPPERLSYMLNEAMTPVLVTESALVERLPSHWSSLVILDEPSDEIMQQPDHAPEVALRPDHLAYVMYTSGSTGMPKGIAVTHRNVIELTRDRRWHDGSQQRVLLHSPQVFDAATYEIWVPLLSGQTVVVAPPGRTDIQRLAEAIQEHDVTAVFLTAALFRLLAQEYPQCLARVRTLWTGGEAATPQAFERVLEQCPDLEMVNVYGPTETTTFATCHAIHAPWPGLASVPIGVPMHNTQAYVLDAQLQPVPLGVTGELYLAGSGLARGYLGRPALTSERFVANPHGVAGSRMYRTGDLARWSSGGVLDFVGRGDHQVKIRGFRIELGEIESALLEQAGVRQAAVVVRDDPSGQRQLVGYVVPGEHAPDADALRRALENRLPKYMVPTAIVTLDALPLTGNGKLDKRALPSPDLASTDFRAPRTPDEAALATLFAQILGRQTIGIDDGFFDCGGDSILAIQLKARAQKAGLGFELSDLFDHQTVATLAEVVRSDEAGMVATSEPFALIDAADRRRLPEGIEDAYPLSHLQLGMLFHSEFEPGSRAYHVVFRATVPLAYDASVMREVLDALSRRHEALRTSYALERYSEPLQCVHESATIPLEAHDVGMLSPHERERQRRLWAQEEAARPFDPAVPPLLRVIVHTAGDQFDLNLSFHHAVMDGWSDASLVTEIIRRYEARLRGEPWQADAITTRYRDYIALERAAITAPASEAFWLEHLRGYEPARPQRVASRVDDSDAHAGGELEDYVAIALDEAVATGLNEVARRAGAQLKTVLLTVHMVALRTLTGRSDVATAWITHGRPESIDSHAMIGLFLNALPFRLRLQHESWLSLIERVKKGEQSLLPHRRYPLPRIMQAMNTAELLTVAFNYTHFHVYNALGDLKDKIAAGSVAGEDSFSLNVDFESSDAGIAGWVYGHRTEYDHATLERYAVCYSRLLHALATDAAANIPWPDLLRENERRHLHIWHGATVSPIAERLPDVLTRQAQATPQAVAVVASDGALTFAALDERANRLAHVLRDHGVAAEDIVALALPRTTDMLVAQWAVLKAGAAFMPLDTEQPRERLHGMLDDARPRLVITLGDTMAGWDSAVPTLVLDAQTTQKQLVHAAAQAPRRERMADEAEALRPAYVIYTSGSTGRPKGVVVTHGALANLYRQPQAAWLAPGEPLRFAMTATFAFDSAIVGLLWMAAGHELHVIDDDTRHDGEALVRYMTQHAVHGLDITPSYFHELARCGLLSLAREQPLSITLAGEAIGDAAWQALASTDNLRGYNGYGPTECTVDATGTSIVAGEPPSIGLPLEGNRAYVLDGSLRPVPPGYVGELYIAGAGLARGYLHRSALTAERFVADPFAPGQRMYRTGDLARRREDGCLDYVGRTDHQVKLRGFRIELGEIEAALAKLGFSRCAVTVREGRAGQKQLVAYVQAAALDTDATRQALCAYLPDYMLPSTIIALDALPLTANGKLDTRRLPPPELASLVTRLPETAREEALFNLFREVLGVGDIGVDDSFFDLGGDSLLATRLIGRARAVLATDLPIRAIYETPTIAGLARRVSHGEQTRSTLAALPLRVTGKRLPLFCLPPAGSRSWCYAGLVSHIDPDIPIYGLDLPSEQERAHNCTLGDLADALLGEIRRIQPQGPYHLAGWSVGGLLAHAIATRLVAMGEEVARLALLDAYPTHALAGDRVLDAGDVPAELRDAIARDGALADAHEPDVYHSDVLFFRATAATPPSLGAWAPYIRGHIDIHDIATDHLGLLDRPWRARIGQALGQMREPDHTVDALASPGAVW